MGGLVVIVPLDPSSAGWNPAKGNGFLRAIKKHRTPSFEGDVKPSAPFRNILQHVKLLCRLWQRYFVSKIYSHFSPSFSCFAAGCLLVFAWDLSWMNREWLKLRLGSTMDYKTVTVHGTHCAIPLCNTKSNSSPSYSNILSYIVV
jgi:hypothetical protein